MKKAENYSDLEKENNIRYMIKGMDLSSNQGKVDFSRIKESEISFVMIRCGYGKNVESQDDFYFERNVSECEKYQIPWGSYFYSYAVNMAEAEDELRHILRLLNDKRPLYPVFINMEVPTDTKRSRMPVIICARTFVHFYAAGWSKQDTVPEYLQIYLG